MSLLVIAAKILAVVISAEDVFGAPLGSLSERLSRFSNAPWIEVPLPLSLSGPPVNVPLPLPLPLPLGPPPVAPPPLAPPLSSSFLCNWPPPPSHRIYPDYDSPTIISDGGPWIVHHPPWWTPWKPIKPFWPKPPCSPCGQPSPPPSSAAPAPAAAPTDAPAPPADAGGDDTSAEEEPQSVDTAGDDAGVVAVNGDIDPAAVPEAPADAPAEEAPAEEAPAEEAPAEEPAEEAPAEEAPAEEEAAEGEGEEGAAALKSPDKGHSGEESATGKPADLPQQEESGEAITEPAVKAAPVPEKQEVSPSPESSLDTVRKSDKVDETLNEVPDDAAGKVGSKDSPVTEPSA